MKFASVVITVSIDFTAPHTRGKLEDMAAKPKDADTKISEARRRQETTTA